MFSLNRAKFGAVLAGVLAVPALILVPMQPATAAVTPVYVDGLRCTIVGTENKDTLKGTAGADVLCGLGGDDTIYGLAGNDTILGGAGNDSMAGGLGADILKGGADTDNASYYDKTTPVVADLDGVTGDDGTSGEKDTVSADVEGLTGGKAADVLEGNTGVNPIFGGAGNDTIVSGGGDDKIYGGDGDDYIIGGGGNDFVRGEAGADRIQGNTGEDRLSGGAGSDTINGQAPGEVDDPNEDDVCEPVATGDSVGNCGFDEHAPVVHSLSFDKSSVDTAAAVQTVTFTMRITDELMGVSRVVCGFSHESIPAQPYGATPPNKLIAGDDIDGTWTCTYTFPKFSSSGNWLPNIYVVDKTGKSASLTATDLTAWALALGQAAPTSISQSGAGDNAGAELRRIELPAIPTIDTSAAAKAVTTYYEFTDDLSGVKNVWCSLRFGIDSVQLNGTVTRVSFNGPSSRWKCVITFPKGSPQGDWFIKVSSIDNTGKMKAVTGSTSGVNTSYDTLTDLEKTGLGRNYISQTGAGDMSAPEFVSVVATPTSVNTSAGARTVTFMIRLTDDLTGVKSLSCGLMKDTVTGPNMTQSTSSQMGYGTRATTANIRNAVWTCKTTLPKGSSMGDWRPTLTATDFAGRSHGLSVAPDGTWNQSGLTTGEQALPVVVIRNGP